MKLAVLLLGVAACNVAGSRSAETFDANSEPVADAGPPDARPRQDPIECEAGWGMEVRTGDSIETTTTWIAKLGSVDVRRAPRVTAWACDYVCALAIERECRPCRAVGPGAECQSVGEPVDHLTEGACFPAEVVIRPSGEAVAICGTVRETRTVPGGELITSFPNRATNVYATVE
jgi:hypothetical protein